MNFTLKITEVKSIHEIEGYWTLEDYYKLLEAFDLSDAENLSLIELGELIEMGITDLEPHESAEILLKLKFKDVLNKGQILNLSHEMVEDNESEEYPDIALHYPLFNINQLLYKSYNGVFQNAKATKVMFELRFKGEQKLLLTKELALKAISKVLSEKNLIIRLFEEQLEGNRPFHEAENIIWELHPYGDNKYAIITSDYWINDEDINEYEFTGTIKEFDDHEG